MQRLGKGTRFKGGELGDTHAHGFGWSQTNIYMIRIEREKEKEIDLCIHLQWPSSY